ncbi:MAG: CvpA family protein [Tannerella sp.]|jgi:membrane protein required for colicin V production|nr:CvpA family protein [Tannerella sp.]
MNRLDIVLAGLAVAGLVKGWADGLVRQVVALVAFVAAIYLCSGVAESFRGYLLQEEWLEPSAATTASRALAFVLIAGLILLAGWVIHRMIDLTPLSLLNRLAGALSGVLLTVFLLSLALNLLDGLDRRSQLVSHGTKVESHLYFHVKEFAPTLFPVELFIWKITDSNDGK